MTKAIDRSSNINMGRIPSIFVSSTCYDLSQVRADLKLFIEHMGFEPILSEYNSFPLDPNLGTVENCLRAVKERADILVLIVGGRYGYQTDCGKSITNLEYLHAKAKGIPVYVFVAKSILSMLQFWKDNPEGNFSSVVDSPKLFEFVETLCGVDNVWVHAFENAQEIIDALRKQWAYLFYDSLAIRGKVMSLRLPKKLLELSGEALLLVVEKPEAWEYRLFGQVFSDGLKAASDIRRDLKYGILFGTGKKFSEFREIFNWFSIKMNDLIRISSGLAALINQALIEAVGKPGEAGDAEHIVYVAEKVVDAYRNAIQWAIDFKSVEVEDEWDELIRSASTFSETLILDLENYCERYNYEISNGLRILAEHGGPVELDLTVTFREPNLQRYSEELNRLMRFYGIEE